MACATDIQTKITPGGTAAWDTTTSMGAVGSGVTAAEGGQADCSDHAELRLVVLALIAERPRHGNEILKEAKDRVAPPPASRPRWTLDAPYWCGLAIVGCRPKRVAADTAYGSAAFLAFVCDRGAISHIPVPGRLLAHPAERPARS